MGNEMEKTEKTVPLHVKGEIELVELGMRIIYWCIEFKLNISIFTLYPYTKTYNHTSML